MKLVEARTNRLLSINALARASSVNVSTIIATEKGRTIPSLRTVDRLSRALELDPEQVDEFVASLRQARRELSRPEN